MTDFQIMDLPEFIINRAIDKGIIVAWIIWRPGKFGNAEARGYNWRDAGPHAGAQFWRYLHF